MEHEPQINSLIHIDDTDYYFCEHPAHYGQLFGTHGQKSIVYQLRSENGNLRALKSFPSEKRRLRYAEIGERLSAYASIPGLQACRRTVLPTLNNTALLASHPNLQCDILMPWISGETWQMVQMYQRKIIPELCLEIARSMAKILAQMEENNMAHCDLCAPNILLPGLQPDASRNSPSRPGQSIVALVDLEDIYLPGLNMPDELPRGMRGYAHIKSSSGSWAPESDRFAGAILLCEMLSWFSDNLRKLSFGESYFDPLEIHVSECERYIALKQVIVSHYGSRLGSLLESAWTSSSLVSCPPLTEWSRVLVSANSPAPSASNLRLRLKSSNPPISTTPSPFPAYYKHSETLPNSGEDSLSPYYQALTAVEKSKTWIQLDQPDQAIQELEDSFHLDPEIISNPLAENLVLRASRQENASYPAAALKDYQRAMAVATSPDLKNRIAAQIMEIRYKIATSPERDIRRTTICPQCRSHLEETSSLCPTCGYDLSRPFSPNSPGVSAFPFSFPESTPAWSPPSKTAGNLSSLLKILLLIFSLLVLLVVAALVYYFLILMR